MERKMDRAWRRMRGLVPVGTGDLEFKLWRVEGARNAKLPPSGGGQCQRVSGR